MTWRWTAYRLAISTFVTLHVGVTIAWAMPNCALKAPLIPPAQYYMLPLGLWQFWAMFAPDPIRDTNTLEVAAIDAKGLRHVYAFTRVADYSKLAGALRFRHSKFASNLPSEEFARPREFAMRHALRQLNLAPDAYPVDAHLMYQVRATPPPGGPPPDPMAPTKVLVLDSHHFETRDEVSP